MEKQFVKMEVSLIFMILGRQLQLVTDHRLLSVVVRAIAAPPCDKTTCCRVAFDGYDSQGNGTYLHASTAQPGPPLHTIAKCRVKKRETSC